MPAKLKPKPSKSIKSRAADKSKGDFVTNTPERPLPPPAGSREELAETALALGWPGAFGTSCLTVESLIRHGLLWREE